MRRLYRIPLMHPAVCISLRARCQPVPGIDALHRLLTEQRIGMHTPFTALRRGEVRTIDIIPVETQPR